MAARGILAYKCEKSLIVCSKGMHLTRAWTSVDTDRTGLHKASLTHLPLEWWVLTQSPFSKDTN